MATATKATKATQATKATKATVTGPTYAELGILADQQAGPEIEGMDTLGAVRAALRDASAALASSEPLALAAFGPEPGIDVPTVPVLIPGEESDAPASAITSSVLADGFGLTGMATPFRPVQDKAAILADTFSVTRDTKGPIFSQGSTTDPWGESLRLQNINERLARFAERSDVKAKLASGWAILRALVVTPAGGNEYRPVAFFTAILSAQNRRLFVQKNPGATKPTYTELDVAALAPDTIDWALGMVRLSDVRPLVIQWGAFPENRVARIRAGIRTDKA